MFNWSGCSFPDNFDDGMNFQLKKKTFSCLCTDSLDNTFYVVGKNDDTVLHKWTRKVNNATNIEPEWLYICQSVNNACN